MTKCNRDLGQPGAKSTARGGQLASPPRAAAASWKMAIATFVGAYIVTAIAIPRELSWLPHSWSFYEINIVTNIIMATAMTWAILPAMSRLLRRWLYGSHDGTLVPVDARRPSPASLAIALRPGTPTVHVAAAAARTASRDR
jgi:ABC-type cobalamin transport system permease subunit